VGSLSQVSYKNDIIPGAKARTAVVIIPRQSEIH
jgi:hypothetical protein